jgi:DNA helicase-2/ATP-dependent DNA helicase PcrA
MLRGACASLWWPHSVKPRAQTSPVVPRADTTAWRRLSFPAACRPLLTAPPSRSAGTLARGRRLVHVTSAVAEQDHLKGLNDEQLAVVTADTRPLRVLAGPGSGKTRVLVTRVAHMIRTQGVNPERILCVSFTNKAAQELQSRLTDTIGSAALGVTVGTFHNVCVRILRKDIAKMDCGVSPTFTIYDEEDATHVMQDKWSELMDAAGPDVKMRLEEGKWAHGNVSRLLSLAKNTTAGSQRALQGADLWDKLLEDGRVKMTDEDDALARRFFVQAVDNYQKALARFNALDFDDILHFTIRLLSARPSTRMALQHKWPHFLVDEFQDTNLAQYELVKLLAMPESQRTAVQEGSSLLVVGDADQAIYGWRGARVGIMRETFMQDFKDLEARTLTLSSNYRSSPQVLAVASAVLAPSPFRSELRVRPIRGAGPRPALWVSDNADMEGEAVAEEIERLLSGSYGGPPVPPQEICILYRVNRLNYSFERALIRRGIPYRVVNGIPILQRTEIKDLLCYLRLVANSCDEVALARIINTPKRKVGEVAQLTVWSWAQATQPGVPVSACLFASPELPQELAGQIQPAARDGLSSLLRSYAGWQRDLPDLSVEELLRRVIRDVQYDSHLELVPAYFDSPTEDGDAGGNASSSRAANVETLLGLAGSVGDPACRGKDALIAFLESLQLQTAVMEMRSTDAVWMGSIHAAKGLEFHAVFCVGLEDGVSPSSMAMNQADLRTQEVYEEERRLVYVAITRAKQHLYLTHTIRPRLGKADGISDEGIEPSPFLHDIHSALGDVAFGIRAVEAEQREQSSGFNRKRAASRPVAVHRIVDKWPYAKKNAGAARGHHSSAHVAAPAPAGDSGAAQAAMPWNRPLNAVKDRAPLPRGSGGPIVGSKSRVRRVPSPDHLVIIRSAE